MGGLAGVPLRKRHDEMPAVGRDARRGHHMGEGAVGPGGGRKEQVSGQAKAFFLEAPESVGGVGETYSPTASPFCIAQTWLRVPTCAGSGLPQLAGASRGR